MRDRRLPSVHSTARARIAYPPPGGSHVRRRPPPYLPERFWSLVKKATPNLPESLRIHHCLPKQDGSEAMCVWEGPSLNEVRDAVESAVGEHSRNEYFEAEAKEGVNLPSAMVGS